MGGAAVWRTSFKDAKLGRCLRGQFERKSNLKG
ncbi:MAG: hypothetical protein DLM68_14640 [Hyphomicrobiales bacterium]|nr:MAG: hypothetical protein DLM68_14640 [Hyphomicrobiales bacterium]